MSSKLSPHQIAQSVYDEPSESVRTTIQNLEIGIELDADDGDSVEIRKPLFHQELLVSSGTDSGTVLGEGDVRYFSEYLVSVSVINEIAASGMQIHVEVSPSDTDNIWFDEQQIIDRLSVPATGNKHIKNSTMGPWRRARAVLRHSGFTAGSFKLYMSGR